jgi:hypothetical protein
MAQIQETRLVDDLDGGPADETVEFALDGRSYVIDLSLKHADALRNGLAEYVIASRRTGGRAKPGRADIHLATPASNGHQPRRESDREENQKIRAWALENGMSVAERGRIPQQVLTAYADSRGGNGGNAKGKNGRKKAA